jgi:hypothetical protein
VPLTVQQVQAQLPRPYSWNHCSSCQHSTSLDQYGRDPMHVSMFGPALTRLTANLVANVLQGKQLVFWTPQQVTHTQAPAGAVECKGQLLGSMIIQSSRRSGSCAHGSSAERCLWPPADRSSLQHAGCEGALDLKSSWFKAHADCSWPFDQQHAGDEPQAKLAERVCLLPSWRGLHLTSDNGYRQATADELRQFVASSTAADSYVFDVLLTSYPSVAPVYIFLDPHPLCVTGRCKVAPGQITPAACLG